MTIEEQWVALETEGPGDGWRLQLARPIKDHPLFVAISGTRRALLLRAPASAIPPRHHWPSSAGLELLGLQLDEQTYLGVALREPRFRDVFAALAEDLARRIETTTSPNEAVATLLDQLTRWQKFLASLRAGLSAEEQRGLWGEIHFLRSHLLPFIGPSVVAAWKGPEGASQDFQLRSGCVEVKTTLANQPQVVRIANERQLDDTHRNALFLHALALEVLEGDAATLPAAVHGLRVALAPHAIASEQFEDALLAIGYFDVHAPRYAGCGYAVRTESNFRVRVGFPRLIENDMPIGVGDASYGLSLAACAGYAVPPEELIETLSTQPSATGAVPDSL
jgi:hypothetical protein